MPAPLEAIAFDWGGIFTEGTFDSSAVRELARLYRLPLAEVEPHYLALMAELEVGAFDLPGLHERLEARLERHADLATFRTTFLGAVRERPAMFDLVAALPNNVRLAMLSNNVPELADGVRADPRLARFETFVFSNEIGARKPDGSAFAALTGALGLSAEQVVFIDDSAANIAACERLGFTGLLLDDLASFAQRWQQALPQLPLPAGLA